MKLTVVWHKPCWSSPRSPTGFASRGCLGHPGFGGLPSQVAALSELFDATRIVGPCSRSGDLQGELQVVGKNVTVVPLSWLPRSPWRTWLILPFWLYRDGRRLAREVKRADAVFALIPSPIGLLGLFLALCFRRPLLIRQVTSWWAPTLPWRLERFLLERIAGGRNVVFATGISTEAPSSHNRAIRWIFTTMVSERQLEAHVAPRSLTPGRCRLIMVGREAELEEAPVVLHALVQELSDVALDIVGDGASLSELQRLASDLQLLDRVTFHGSVSRERLVELLGQAHLFCCLPTDETEAFRQALHEALASGLPVVTAPTSVAPTLTEKGCGTVLNERTPEALAAAVNACLSDPARYRSMSIEALRTARHHSLERWCEAVRAALVEAWGPLQAEPAAATRP